MLEGRLLKFLSPKMAVRGLSEIEPAARVLLECC